MVVEDGNGQHYVCTIPELKSVLNFVSAKSLKLCYVHVGRIPWLTPWLACSLGLGAVIHRGIIIQ